MGRDFIDVLCSVLLIGGLLAFIKLIGCYIEKILRKGNTKRVINNIECEVLKNTPQEIWIGGKKLIQSQIEAIVKDCKESYVQIVFLEGHTRALGKRYAVFADGVLRYESGKKVEIYKQI